MHESTRQGQGAYGEVAMLRIRSSAQRPVCRYAVDHGGKEQSSFDNLMDVFSAISFTLFWSLLSQRSKVDYIGRAQHSTSAKMHIHRTGTKTRTREQ